MKSIANCDEVLLLGPRASGKSLLVNRLKWFCNKSEMNFNPMPTLGVERDVIALKSRKIVLREVGAAMMATWPSYINSCNLLLFVIDPSDRIQLGVACAELMQCLRDMPEAVPALIVFTHKDFPMPPPAWELNALLRLPDLRSSPKAVKSIDISAMNNEGIDNLLSTIESMLSA